MSSRKTCNEIENASESDYTILSWRQKSPDEAQTSTARELPAVLHLHNPAAALPSPPSYCNPAYYTFKRAMLLPASRSGSVRGSRSIKSSKSRKSGKSRKDDSEEEDGVPKFKKEFFQFHNENGVRTVIGSIGPVNNGEYLMVGIFAGPRLGGRN